MDEGLRKSKYDVVPPPQDEWKEHTPQESFFYETKDQLKKMHLWDKGDPKFFAPNVLKKYLVELLGEGEHKIEMEKLIEIAVDSYDGQQHNYHPLAEYITKLKYPDFIAPPEM